MKNLKLLFLFSLVFFQVNAQSKKFEFTKDNPSLNNQYVVIEKDSMPISDGYSKMIEFIKMNYDSDKVIKSQVENKYIKIGAYDNVPSNEANPATMDFDYVIEFRFKTNKIQMKIVSVTRTTNLGVLPFDNPNNAPNTLWENGINNLLIYFNNLKNLIESSLNEDGDGW